MNTERLIQSYGRKRSRGLSDTQKNNLVTLYDQYGIDVPETKVHPNTFFNRSYDNFMFEIGFGRGEHLIQNAINNPNIGFIGCEPFENGVASALKAISDNELNNVRIYKGDARLLLNMIQEKSIERTYVLFPDPWTKKKHFKRRLLSVEFLKEIASKTTDTGSMVVATDCLDYMENVLLNLHEIPNLEYESDTSILANKPDWFLSTRYEQKALSKGKNCYYLKCNISR